MEIFNPPPYREQRKSGRPTKLTDTARMAVAKKVIEKELTYREAAELFSISTGAVSTCVKDYKNRKVNSRRRDRRQEVNSDVANHRHQSEVKELKQEIADLYLENQMLKKFLNKSLVVKKEAGSVITTDNVDRSPELAE